MNRTTKTLLIAGVAAIVGSAGVAGVVKARDWHDDSRGHRPGMHESMRERGFAMMEQLDLNKDGTLTQDEIDQARKDQLAKFDTNKDGKLSLKEYEALWLDAHRQQMVRDFQRLDTNGDAAVTQEEFTKPFQHLVEFRDRNHDGKLNKDDMSRRGPHRDAPTVTPAPAAPGEPKGAPK